MGLLRFAIIIASICVALILTHKTESEKTELSQPQQPIHFDLIDDNGDKLPKEPVIQELQYFCIKDKGYHISVWPKDNRIGEILEFPIAGMSYRDDIDEYIGEHDGILKAEPDNEYDPNAIKVLTEDGHHVGYVPADMTEEIRTNTDLPCPCFFYIGENDGTYFSDCYVTIN